MNNPFQHFNYSWGMKLHLLHSQRKRLNMQNIRPAIKLPGETHYKPFQLTYAMIPQPPNMHVIHAVRLPITERLPARIKIRSLRFKQGVVISENDSATGLMIDIVTGFLTAKGFNLIGMGEGDTGFYFFTDTFKPIK